MLGILIIIYAVGIGFNWELLEQKEYFIFLLCLFLSPIIIPISAGQILKKLNDQGKSL